MLFTLIIISKCNALLSFSSTSSYLLVMDFCKANYIRPLRTILTVCLQHPFQKGLIIIDRDDRKTGSSRSGQLNNLLSQLTSHRPVAERAFLIHVSTTTKINVGSLSLCKDQHFYDVQALLKFCKYMFVDSRLLLGSPSIK